MNDKVYYTVEIPYTVAATPIDKEYWIPFTGEDTGIFDWWNEVPRRYSSYDDAIKAIESSDNFKNRKWRIVKTTITNEVVGTYN